MMKMGFKSVVINPEFPVNRMLNHHGEKHQACWDDLHLRMIVLEAEGHKPWYHVSIDSVEIWLEVRNRIKQAIEETVGREIDIVVSATHSHNCPCMTTDYAWIDFVIEKIRANVGTIEMTEYKEVTYSYQYRYFNKIGDSREADLKHKAVHLYAETLSLYGDGERKITFLIHNCHPTILALWKSDFTSEYPGYCIKKLSEAHPGEFFTFLLGPAGDVSPHFVRKSQDYEEIARLGDILTAEFERQLSHQENREPVNAFRYREQMIKVEKGDPVSMGTAYLPPAERLTEQEKKTLEQRYLNPRRFSDRQLEPMEITDESMFSQLILNENYSIIFEPHELYSEFYGAVNKQTTTLATISNGFDHYVTGMYLNHITMHTFSEFGPRMKRDMWEMLGKWSLQEEAEF